MVDTFTPSLQFIQMAVGGDQNAWGANANALFQMIEDAIVGTNTISGLTGGSTTPTDNQLHFKHQILTGTLTADQTIVLPNRTQHWRFLNNTTGAFAVILNVTGTSAKVNAPAGKMVEIYTDGNGNIRRGDAHMVGTFFMHGGTAAPPGSFECDGSTYLRASFIDLFASHGTTWGAGNGSTTVNLPNGKSTGSFLRSRTGSLTIGTSQSNQVGPHAHSASFSSGVTDTQGNHAHTGSGTTSGTSNDHTHTVGLAPNGALPTAFGGNYNGVGTGLNTGTSGQSADHTHTYSFTTSTQGAHSHNVSGTVTVNSNGTTETRPEALVGMLCVWY